MTPKRFPGGWYADALPSGAYAVQMPGSRFVTHLGDIVLPPQEAAGYGPLFVRVTDVGGFRFAGQGHSTIATWEYRPDDGWHALPAAVGVSPVIYDLLGILHLSDGAIGSQGYRYVDGANRIWTGDETYGPSAHGVSEFTRLGGDIEIGQGHDVGGVVVWIDGALRMLEAGPCYTVRAHRVGEDVAIAFWRDAPREAVLIWTTVAELRALPVLAPPVPPDPPVPPPGGPVKLPPNVKSTCSAYVSANPVPAITPGEDLGHFEDRCRLWTRGIAEQVRFSTGLITWGTKASSPGAPQSKDAIAQNGSPLLAWDMLSGAGTGHPSYNADPDSMDITGQFFIAVAPVDHSGGTPPPNPPDPPPSDDVQRQIDWLKAENAAQTARLNSLESSLAALAGRAVQYGQRVGLRTDNGHLVCAEGGGGAEVNATRTNLGGWESFTPERG